LKLLSCTALAALLLGGLFLPAAGGQEAPLSPRNANYIIDVELDPDSRTLTGRLVLEWRNLQQQPTDELWFHLYWNAWRNNRSTWLLEDRIRGRSSAGKKLQKEDWAYQVVDSVRLLNLTSPETEGPAADLGVPLPQDLTSALRFAAPDDGNEDDRTVAVLKLPFQVEPGQSLQVEMSWRARVPRTFARTGVRKDFYFVAHWFPKLGVFEETGWNCHQFHSATEFFSDYGVYNVRITLPERFVVGASGTLQELKSDGSGSSTHSFAAQDVHGFTWTASPDFLERTETFQEPGLPTVEMRLLLQPEHKRQAERHFAATRAALKYYGEWYGPYPYGNITIVDPAYGSGAGGMEYPTLFTSGTRLLNPMGGGSPEGVTIHEAGHQFWYGVVGNNEFEHAWLDEGLNTFSTARAYEAAFGNRLFMKRYLGPSSRGGRGKFLPVLFPDLELSRDVYGNRLDRFRGVAHKADVQAQPTYLNHPALAARISYDKTSLWLATLERYLGWETLQQILSTFYQRWQFQHPRPQDLFNVANEVSGQDLSWFFDQVHGGSQIFDYGISRADSKPSKLRGWTGPEQALTYAGDDEAAEGEGGNEGDSRAEGKTYRTEVVVHRIGEGVFPVDVLLTFDDDSEIRRTWDGRDRWTMIVEEGPQRLVHAEVDPGKVLLLDVDRTNNSRLVESSSRLPAVKWGSKWMVWLQDLLQTSAFFF